MGFTIRHFGKVGKPATANRRAIAAPGRLLAPLPFFRNCRGGGEGERNGEEAEEDEEAVFGPGGEGRVPTVRSSRPDTPPLDA